MGEGFKANPDHIAGYGQLMYASADHIGDVAGHVYNEAKPDDGFSGLMSLIKGPVDLYAHKTGVRLFNRYDRLAQSSRKVEIAAWMYSGVDESVYKTYNHAVPGPPREEYKDYPSPASYPPAEDPVADLEAPAKENADIRAILDEVGGLINGIDDAVAFITGWSPVSALVEPMSGNWTRLERCGEVLKQAGDGAEKVAKNLTTGLSTLDPEWNGGAAQDFNTYITNISKAIDMEGPLNRIVAGVYTLVAQQIEKVATWMVEVLKTAVDKIVQAAASAWIPGAGWIKIIDAVKTAIEVFNEAMTMVEELNRVVEAVKTVVELAQDPVGFLEGQVEEKLAPYREKLDQANAGLDVAKDLAELSDTSVWGNSPKENYEVGADPNRAGA